MNAEISLKQISANWMFGSPFFSDKITLKKRNFEEETDMNANSKRIDTQFSNASYEVIKRAAEICGSSVRSFSAQVIMREALSIVERYENEQIRQLPELEISDEARRELLEYFQHPEQFKEGVEKLLKIAEEHPFKEIE